VSTSIAHIIKGTTVTWARPVWSTAPGTNSIGALSITALAEQQAREDRRHPVAALVRFIDEGCVPLPWVVANERTWERSWAKARLRDRIDLIVLVNPRLHRQASQWSYRIREVGAPASYAKRMANGEGGVRNPNRFAHGYGGDQWPRGCYADDELGWIYRRHVPAPSLSDCVAAARKRRTGDDGT
jgi:hypothetical protein